MQITHQEARSLIQFRADQVLNADKKELLNAHLNGCVECTDYANQIQETEATLRTTLKKRWNIHHVPLHAKDIKARVNSKVGLPESLVPTRSALVGITVLLFVFGLMQLTSTNHNPPGFIAVGVPAIPTPSLSLTSTQNNLVNCQLIRYEVHQDDTLESLARRFSVSEEALIDLNHLQTESGPLPVKLIVPFCELTPTSTTHPPTSTTDTPSFDLIIYTPG